MLFDSWAKKFDTPSEISRKLIIAGSGVAFKIFRDKNFRT